MMKELRNRGAFVTGAANGIGLGIARVLAKAGVNMVLADIDAAALEVARAEVERLGVYAHAVTLDVSDRAAMQQAAAEARAALGRIHIVINNAGVSLGPVPVAAVGDNQWDWILGVNLRGVVNGVAVFLSHLRAHGEAAHIVNTASIGGLRLNPYMRNGSYSATKYGVVAVSEALALELEGSNIGVSVLCPAAVPTTLSQSPERRPSRFGGGYAPAPVAQDDDPARRLALGNAIDPETVGRRVLRAITHGEFFIFTHPHTRAWLEARHARLMAGFDQLDDFLAAETRLSA
jgi:NAD(P)-dependent dehydrogenase (short-subunit alcohol dehydrogenase family)